MKRRLGPVLVALLLVVSACGSSDRVIVAAGTTLVDSGFIDRLVAVYEAEHPAVELSVVGESTARVLDLGRRGAADLLITHAPDLEAQFVAEGLAARYEPVLTSYFVLAGPPDLMAGAPTSVEDFLRWVAARGDIFVSRSDGSGTHEREMELWNRAGIDPVGSVWYIETGQGMGLTLQVADQRRAFVLCEIGVLLAALPSLSLMIVPLDEDSALANPYSVIVVNGAPAPAGAFASWLLSDGGRRAVLDANQDLFGEVVYRPAGP